jgi:hypothetical protein
VGEYDKSSKWLIQNHGDSILRLAGVTDILSWRPLQAEVVQPRQLPDGLIEAQLAGDDALRLYIIELATYPEERLREQLLRDAMLVYLDRRELPEVLALVLARRGRRRSLGSHSLHSPGGWTDISARWRVVELWTLPADELLRTGDAGLMPWVPLTEFSQPVTDVLRQCRQVIESGTSGDDRPNFSRRPRCSRSCAIMILNCYRSSEAVML